MKILIIGAGPAGLTAAWELSKHNLNSKILESDKETGSEEDKIASAYAQFQSKAGVYPKIIDSSKDNLDYVNAAERMGFFTFDDPDLLRAISRNDTQGNPYQQGQVLLPIKFTFTIHGVRYWDTAYCDHGTTSMIL